jgi:beta-xylosidase
VSTTAPQTHTVATDNGGPTPTDISRDTADDRAVWRDPDRTSRERVADLLGRMTLEEKVSQLVSFWTGVSETTEEMAPHQHEFAADVPDWAELTASGLGQLTRPFGTAPVSPTAGAQALARVQAEIMAAGRFGIPALVHEECLTGFMAWQATVFPTALAWGASFDPALIQLMAARIGAGLKAVGVHQGLAPVLDVMRDPRWGRTEETIAEDPYLVATIGTAYVQGLQSAGVVATLKHFAGYSGSRGGRNFGPVGIGPRELHDIILPPFEMAIVEGGARSVMHSYAEVDGVPAGADGELLTTLLRDTWGFEGTVVADYFGVSFLESLHGVAGSPGEAAGLALSAGVDVELPAVRCYSEPLLAAIRAGQVSESLVDRAAERVLRQKCELGLLDPDWSPQPSGVDGYVDAGSGVIDLDPPGDRALARQIAEESIVLVANRDALPLSTGLRIAVVGPQADSIDGMLGCYTFPSHVGSQHPHTPVGVEIRSLVEVLRADGHDIDYALGCRADGSDRSLFGEAAAAAGAADVCVAVLGDRSGLFGRGTSGEGCDANDLRLPGVQADLLEAVLATGTPVVLVLLSGRPYALGEFDDRLAAIVVGFFPGQEGAAAVAGVLTGSVCPSGRLPVSLPRTSGGQPGTYLAPLLGRRTDVSSIDPTPSYPFGHGLSYTSFVWEDVTVAGRPAEDVVHIRTDGSLAVAVTVRNTGARSGADVVQLYLHDPVAQVTRPVIRLVGYAKVALEPGQARRVTFDVPADLTSFTNRAGRRIVEPGDIELRLSSSSVQVRTTVRARLTGTERQVDHHRRLRTAVTITA